MAISEPKLSLVRGANVQKSSTEIKSLTNPPPQLTFQKISFSLIFVMLSSNRKSLLETIVNILTIVVAVAFLALLVHKYVLPNEPKAKMPTVGNIVSIPGFEPSLSKRNVLLVLMKGCRFCEDSMTFYKDLVRRTLQNEARTIAVFPPKTENAEGYVQQFGLDSVQVTFAPLGDLDVDGTPTLFVTDQEGRIISYWVGRLSKEKEAEVYSQLE